MTIHTGRSASGEALLDVRLGLRDRFVTNSDVDFIESSWTSSLSAPAFARASNKYVVEHALEVVVVTRSGDARIYPADDYIAAVERNRGAAWVRLNDEAQSVTWVRPSPGKNRALCSVISERVDRHHLAGLMKATGSVAVQNATQVLVDCIDLLPADRRPPE